MADAAQEQAIAISKGIVGALHAAGVLQTQALFTSAPSAGSEGQVEAISTGIVSALSAVGVLNTQGTLAPAGATGAAPPPPEPQVGDVHSVAIQTLWKIVTTTPLKVSGLSTLSAGVMIQLVGAQRLDQAASLGTIIMRTSYMLEFPPSDDVFLSEFDRLFTVDKNRPLNIQAELEITKKLGNNFYGAKLTRFFVQATF